MRVVATVLCLLATMLLVGEALLFGASKLSNHPLLTSLNAETQLRIEAERKAMLAFYGAVDERGYDDTHWNADPGDAFRIVALGDSFAFGVVGYEHDFLTLLESDLAQRLGRPVEVANLGIPSMQPKEYLQILLDDGLALHPDLILVCLYTGTDFQATRGESRLDARNWRVVAFASRFARYVAEREFRESQAQLEGAPTSSGSAPAFTEDGYFRIVDAYVPLLRRERPEKAGRGMRETFSVVEDIFARAHPTPIAIAVLPSELQVSSSLRAQLLARAKLAEPDLDLDRPARETREYFEPKGIRVIDLLPAFAAAEREAPTYALRNSHWNERGNTVAAGEIAEALAPQVRALSAQSPR